MCAATLLRGVIAKHACLPCGDITCMSNASVRMFAFAKERYDSPSCSRVHH